MNTRQNIFLWILYDFANSLVSVVFFLYFAQWLVVEQNVPDIWYNLVFTFSTILLVCTAPFVGLMLDRHLKRIVGLRWTTAFSILLYGLSAGFAIAGSTVLAMITFTVTMYVYTLSFSFYTPLINDISTPEKRGKISGLGIAANYIGQFFGLLVVLPFATGYISFFGVSARVETLLPAVVVFALATLPMLLFFKEIKVSAPQVEMQSYFKHLKFKTKALFAFPGIGLFLVAYFFFNDAVLTAASNYPIFLQQIWGVSDTIKTLILSCVITTSAIGGLIGGVIADRFGHKRTLLYILVGWLVIMPSVGFAQNIKIFVFFSTIMGFWFGASWTVARSVMAYLAPREHSNLAFSYYNLVERASSFVGPVAWGLIVTSLAHLGSIRYRFATLAVTLFIFFGLWALTYVRSDREHETP